MGGKSAMPMHSGAQGLLLSTTSRQSIQSSNSSLRGSGISPQRRPILLVHIHKAGGTTLCTWAKEVVHLTTPLENLSRDEGFFSRNCNPASKDRENALGYRGPE